MPVIEKVIDNLQIQSRNHRIELTQASSNDLVLGERSKLEHVFTNLINNAIKYSPAGGKIHIHMYRKDDKLLVDVADNGLGIPADALNKIFTKFFRVDNSDRRTIGGTGLGLAIVKEMMKAHDGDIIVHSEYGKGSTFTLAFPAVEGELQLTSENLPTLQDMEYSVMLIEDDQSLSELIHNELSESGFKVVRFEKGEQALKFIETSTPDAIVLDIMLEEELDGWHIMKTLKESERLKNIPVIISTALDEKEKGISLGANDYLIKPYNPSQLSRALMQTLLKIGKVGQILVPENE
ncbi:response regulator [Bacillus sp. Bva_UNVM-123]|uniref:ATP-binding response regulator n=1 Tax=Bacillus sp. Bva_UNVM-123 TaxID=2829798 RepID=UPI00391F639A